MRCNKKVQEFGMIKLNIVVSLAGKITTLTCLFYACQAGRKDRLLYFRDKKILRRKGGVAHDVVVLSCSTDKNRRKKEEVYAQSYHKRH